MDEKPGAMNDKADPLRVQFRSYALLNNPRLNKGTAFTDEERDAFGLRGLLPPHLSNLNEQVERRLRALRSQPTRLRSTRSCVTCRIRTKPCFMR